MKELNESVKQKFTQKESEPIKIEQLEIKPPPKEKE